MVEIDVGDGLLRVRLTGWDRLWALKRDFAVPLARVTAVRVDPQTARAPMGCGGRGRTCRGWSPPAATGAPAGGTSGASMTRPGRS